MRRLLSLVEEIARTAGDLRARVSQSTDTTSDFPTCAVAYNSMGILLKVETLRRADPSISDAPALDDDLLHELKIVWLA
jgi:hypothetical protein